MVPAGPSTTNLTLKLPADGQWTIGISGWGEIDGKDLHGGAAVSSRDHDRRQRGCEVGLRTIGSPCSMDAPRLYRQTSAHRHARMATCCGPSPTASPYAGRTSVSILATAARSGSRCMPTEGTRSDAARRDHGGRSRRASRRAGARRAGWPGRSFAASSAFANSGDRLGVLPGAGVARRRPDGPSFGGAAPARRGRHAHAWPGSVTRGRGPFPLVCWDGHRSRRMV